MSSLTNSNSSESMLTFFRNMIDRCLSRSPRAVLCRNTGVHLQKGVFGKQKVSPAKSILNSFFPIDLRSSLFLFHSVLGREGDYCHQHHSGDHHKRFFLSIQYPLFESVFVGQHTGSLIRPICTTLRPGIYLVDDLGARES